MRRLLLLLLAAGSLGFAHVGSPDVFFEGAAGPYRLFVTVRPPVVIPGVAHLEIRGATPDLRELRITPLPLTGPAAKLAPTPDLAERSKSDPQFFTGNLWIMRSGSWQVRIQASGARGDGEMAVPIPAVALRTEKMNWTLGMILLPLMLILATGAISIAGAAVREGELEPGAVPGPDRRRRARLSMTVAAALVMAMLYLGNAWWDAEAGFFRRYLYKPLEVSASTDPGGTLSLTFRDPGSQRFPRKLDALLPDHGHLMHLFVTRLPAMDRIWHLHPEQIEPGRFAQQMPAIKAGWYQLYADVVLQTGMPETAAAEIDLPAVTGKPLVGDDSAGDGPPFPAFGRTFAELSDGGRMIWERDSAPIVALRPASFRFRLEDKDGEDKDGRSGPDLELYMGMPGHAVFVRSDQSVFAHVHPSGSVPMAALALAGADPHTGHAALPPEVSFPYGFPRPGDYRIFVQVKRAGRVETGTFDVRVQ